MESECETLLKEIISVSNISELTQIQTKLEELKKALSLNESHQNLIKIAIIDFLIKINPLSNEWKEKEISEIAHDLVSIYFNNNMNELIIKRFDKIKNPFLKFLIEINIAFQKDKENIKLCLKIILLSRNKELIISYMKNLISLSISDIQYIENEISNLNFNNPFSIIFIHELIKILFNEKKDKLNFIEEVNENIKNVQIFRCSQCFDLLYVHHNENGTSLICNNKLHSIINSKSIKQEKNYDIKCSECKNLIKIYYDNYKCIHCKVIICNKCAKNHYNNCLFSELINLYHVGYICEIHNKKYIDSCDLCNKNLCEKCKLYHFHIIKKENHVKLDEKELIKSINMNKLEKTKNYIKYYLFKRYQYMKRFNLINLKIIKSLHFMVNKENITFNPNVFFSQKFFDDEFKKYYKPLIDESLAGKIKEFDAIKLLKKEYNLVNLLSNDDEYNNFKDLCSKNQIKRENDLNDIYSLVSNVIISIHKLFNSTIIFSIQKLFNENNVDIKLLKSKIFKIKINQSNQMGQLLIKKLLSRYFSDYIIKLLIKKYPFKFKPIILNMNNIYEIINIFGVNIIKKNEIDSIKIFLENFLSQDKKENKEQYLINYINNIKEDNKIIFKESITIGNNTLLKNELNFVLGALLYIIKRDNILSHQIIESNIDAKINEISKNVSRIEELFGNNWVLSCNISKDDSLIDITLKNEVKETLNKLEEEILKDFNYISFDKSTELDNILNYIFKNNPQKIFKKNNAFLSVIYREINSLIDDEKDFDENDLFNKIINEFIINPKMILSKINEYEALIKDKLKKFETYNVEKNEKFENKIKSDITDLDFLGIDFSTFPILIDRYIIMLENNLSNAEIKAYISSIFGKLYLKSEIFKKEKKNLREKFRECLKSEIIKRKIKKICNLIEFILDENINDFDETTFINNVKKFIKEQEFEGCDKISEQDFNLEKIMEILKTLITEKNIDWLALSKEESSSLMSYLYYMQNKN